MMLSQILFSEGGGGGGSRHTFLQGLMLKFLHRHANDQNDWIDLKDTGRHVAHGA